VVAIFGFLRTCIRGVGSSFEDLQLKTTTLQTKLLSLQNEHASRIEHAALQSKSQVDQLAATVRETSAKTNSELSGIKQVPLREIRMPVFNVFDQTAVGGELKTFARRRMIDNWIRRWIPNLGGLSTR
jgi:hypothetical protein